MLDCPRNTPRAAYYLLYRLARIAARETRAGLLDAAIYGHSTILIGAMAHDGCQHIPYDKVVLSPAMYGIAETAGIDMSNYMRDSLLKTLRPEPIPRLPNSAPYWRRFEKRRY